MKELVEFIVKSLVDNPEKLVITTEEEGEVLKIFIKADENDIGKIRTIVRSSAMKLGKKVIIEIN